jgi:hypothetical protein
LILVNEKRCDLTILDEFVGKRVMPTYTITFRGLDGGVHSQKDTECACDDDAIDAAGDSTHPYEIDVHEGDRHVVRFPPWPRL